MNTPTEEQMTQALKKLMAHVSISMIRDADRAMATGQLKSSKDDPAYRDEVYRLFASFPPEVQHNIINSYVERTLVPIIGGHLAMATIMGVSEQEIRAQLERVCEVKFEW